MRRPLATIPALLAALALSACGGSRAPGVQLAPSGGATAASATPTPSSTSTSATATTPTPTTPKPPSPLARKPVVNVPGGPPPKTLVVRDLIRGTGPAAASGKQVTVNYVGVLYKNGREFDSSWKHGTTFPFTLGQGQVIKGWDQGIVGERVGGRRELIIPPNLAYGAAGSPPTIPPNSTLVFVVDVLGVS